MAEIKKKTVAIAGAGDVAKFVVEELLRDGLYEIVIMSRNVSFFYFVSDLNFVP